MIETAGERRKRLYKEIQAGLHRAEFAAQEMATITEIAAGERNAVRKAAEQIRFYNQKMGILRNIDTLKPNEQ